VWVNFLPLDLILTYLILKELRSIYQQRKNFYRGFELGVNNATSIFGTMKYRLLRAAEVDALDCTLYITGRIDVPNGEK